MRMDTLGNALLVARSTLGTAVRGVRGSLDAHHRASVRLARLGLRIPDLPPSRRAGTVWAISMVRNEIDVLPTVLDHLEAQGVDHVLVSDNGSTDGTLELLEERAADGRLHLARDQEPAFYQAAKLTVLAHAARRSGAEWVVPFDADELWFARDGLLGDDLRRQEADGLGARLFNTFPTPSGGWAMDPTTGLGKVAFRSHRLAVISSGNHRVDRPGPRLEGDASPLRIAHLPWRSFDQFAAKLRQGAQAYQLTTGLVGGDHWRVLGVLEDEVLRGLWEGILAGRTDERLGWTPRADLVAADPTTWSTWDPDGVVERARSAGGPG
jgi:Glycosyl transferase family 2